MHSRLDQSMTWLCVHPRFLSLELSSYLRFIFWQFHPYHPVLSDTMGVKIFFVTRTVSDSGAGVRFCATLPPSPTIFRGITLYFSRESLKKIQLIFFMGWSCHLTLVNGSPGGVWWTVRRWYSIFILSTVWSGESSVKLEKLGETWWKAWLSSVPCLIINPFDNQTRERLWPYLDYHDQWYFPKPS